MSKRLLEGSPETPRSKAIPALTAKQAEALDAVHFIAEANSVKLSHEERRHVCHQQNDYPVFPRST
ncbi:uncharacterized protein PV07_05826 [Cladophialophora immunda]|uniref:Uncharacterized protein n=1 Tax=Cladophialophora immunda TaxID=569365 RepID=A0A0D2AXP6_9EURO|nr:uncharacterized protein PV07_05826 [Cladophialophora immunda]KIW30047.1 hypothetical protein PV07_05826 [Cladophialophora immunda]